MIAFREARSLSTVGFGTRLARGIGLICTVGEGLGALLELLFDGLQARTVNDRVASRKVLRVTSKPFPRVLMPDRQPPSD